MLKNVKLLNIVFLFWSITVLKFFLIKFQLEKLLLKGLFSLYGFLEAVDRRW